MVEFFLWHFIFQACSHSDLWNYCKSGNRCWEHSLPCPPPVETGLAAHQFTTTWQQSRDAVGSNLKSVCAKMIGALITPVRRLFHGRMLAFERF